MDISEKIYEHQLKKMILKIMGYNNNHYNTIPSDFKIKYYSNTGFTLLEEYKRVNWEEYEYSNISNGNYYEKLKGLMRLYYEYTK